MSNPPVKPLFPPVMYRVEIPEVITRSPVQSIVDGFTVLHHEGGMKAVEAALEAVIEVVLKEPS